MNQDHSKQSEQYDGISEHDHPLPQWWLLTFYASIAFAGFYVLYQTIGPGLSGNDQYALDLEKHKASVLLKSGTTGPIKEEELVAAIGNSQAKADGQKVYIAKCAACHLPDGGGSVGPNLTDSHWIHGDGKPMSILGVIQKGVLDKGMPAWESQLSSTEVLNVTSFVVSLKGTQPSNPKPPQGPNVE